MLVFEQCTTIKVSERIARSICCLRKRTRLKQHGKTSSKCDISTNKAVDEWKTIVSASKNRCERVIQFYLQILLFVTSTESHRGQATKTINRYNKVAFIGYNLLFDDDIQVL